MATKTLNLTDAQLRLLRGMSDDEYQFPGRLERSANVLRAAGFAECDQRRFSHDYQKGEIVFKLSYRRTTAGRLLAESH